MKYWRMSGKWLDMKSWRRFMLMYIIKWWEGQEEGESMKLLGWGWRKCFTGKAFGKGYTLRIWGVKKIKRKQEKDTREKEKKGRVACGYELISFNVFWKTGVEDGISFNLSGNQEWSKYVELCFFNSSEEKVSLGDVEFEVPTEPQVGVFKRKWETDLELLSEELWLERKIWELQSSRCVYGEVWGR